MTSPLTADRASDKATDSKVSADELLQRARQRADASTLYAGAVTPPEAWALFQQGVATLVDVRTEAELGYVGYVPNALHVEWLGAAPEQQQRFVEQLKQALPADPERPVLLLCRSGARSHQAALVAAREGYTAFNVLEGFEGKRDQHQHRSSVDGWRYHGLPWVQE